MQPLFHIEQLSLNWTLFRKDDTFLGNMLGGLTHDSERYIWVFFPHPTGGISDIIC